MGQRSRRFGELGAGWWAAPHPRPFPHKQRGGRVTRGTGCRSAIEFSSPPCSSGGRGRERGGACGRSSMPFVDARIPAEGPPADAVRWMSYRVRILLSPMGFMGERPGEGGACGRSSMPSPTPGSRGGAPRGRSSMDVVSRSNSPLPLGFMGERPGEGGACGRSSMPFADARSRGGAPRGRSSMDVVSRSNSPLPHGGYGGEAGRGGRLRTQFDAFRRRPDPVVAPPRTQFDGCRIAIEFSSPPWGLWGRGRERGAPADAVRCLSSTPGSPRRGPPRTQCDASRRVPIRRQPQPPPGFFGGGGPVVPARRGRGGGAGRSTSDPAAQRSLRCTPLTQ